MSPRTALLVGAAVTTAVVAGAAVMAALHVRSNAQSSPAQSPYRGSTVPPGVRAASFTLRDFRGETITMDRLRGRVVILSFVDSKCKESCPVVTSVMARALRQLSPRDRSDVVGLLMTVDPRVDTPMHVRRFLEIRRALNLKYLLGPLARMRQIWKAYGVLPAVDTGDADVHSSDVRIFDRRGIWVTSLHAGVDLNVRNLLHDTALVLHGDSGS